MTEKHYIPTPVFCSLNEVIDQYKSVYADENPSSIPFTSLINAVSKELNEEHPERKFL